jgi:hypothetical protein
MASVHDVEELRSEIEDLRADITGSHFIPIQPDSEGRPDRKTSSPPGLNWTDRLAWRLGRSMIKLGTLIGVTSITVAVSVVTTILVMGSIKDCHPVAAPVKP